MEFWGDKTKGKEIFKEETVGKEWKWRIIGRKEEEEGKKRDCRGRFLKLPMDNYEKNIGFVKTKATAHGIRLKTLFPLNFPQFF